jgi:Predicted transcriptional regulator
MQVQMPDLVDTLWFARKEAGLRYPKAAASRLAQKGVLIRLKQGLYLRSGLEHDAYALGSAANRLYGPSYVSFVWALRFYGLISEDVPHITSATFAKGRSKRFDTPAGSFFYHDVPPAAYPLSLTFLGDEKRRFLVASPEKALCDELYLKSQVRALKEIPALLFEDMRIDEERFFALDRERLGSLALVYKNTTLHTLIRFLEKEKSDRSRSPVV